MTELSQALLRARRAAGFPQREVADALGVPHGYASRWERAAVRPGVPYLFALAELFGLDSGELLHLRLARARPPSAPADG